MKQPAFSSACVLSSVFDSSVPVISAVRRRLSGPLLALLFCGMAVRLQGQGIEVTNYSDTRVVTYPVVLLRGTLGGTTITVTNNSSPRPATRVMPGLVAGGQFRALADLVPGQNHLTLSSGANTLDLTLRYVPQTNARIVRPLLYTLSSGSTDYPTPLTNDPQNWQAKLGVMMKIMQTFTAESMHDQGYPRLTFNLPLDPATGEVTVTKLVGEHDGAFYYNQTYDRDQLWYEAYDLIGEQMPNANAKNVAIVAFSRYDAPLDYKYAHTALGGGYLGLMGGLSLWACPDSVADILPTYMDGSTAYPALQGESDEVYLAANEITGAAMHELGHSLGRPHEGVFDLSIMQRGFDHMYRMFTLTQPDGTTWQPDRVGNWSPESAAHFAANHQWFEYPPPVARLEQITPDPLPQMLTEVTAGFDQPVTGVTPNDFTLEFNGAPVPEFGTSATVVQVTPAEYRVTLGALADSPGAYRLTLHAGAAGITNAGGKPLYDDRSATWTRGPDALPVIDMAQAMNVTDSTAMLSARLATTGGSTTTVTAVWGLTDAGPTTSGWAQVVPLGPWPRGPVSVALTGLPAQQTHYFRFRAVNALGTVWSPAILFVTRQLELLPAGTVAAYNVPANNADDNTWFVETFDDHLWPAGASGLGYETSGTDYAGLIATNLQSAIQNRATVLRTRFTFNVPNRAALTAARLRLKYDDGFVAWLNGTPVARNNAPQGNPAWNASASASHSDSASAAYEDYDLTPYLGVLHDTGNVLAIQVMNENITSSDILVLPEITASTSLAVPLIAPGAGVRALIPTSSTSAAGWHEREFADTAWLSGSTGVGYERATGYQSLIQLNVPQMYNTNTTCYLRIPFNVENPSVLNSLVLRMKYDDAYVAWINGGLVAQSPNAPAALAWNAAATAIHDDADAVIYEDTDISSHLGRLVPGVNVLAIHALNDSLTSSDFLMLPELIATRPPPPAFPSYAAWIAGFSVADPAQGADPDADGASNQEEYIHDTHPGQPDRPLRAVRIAALQGDRVMLTFRTAAARTYRIEFTANLTTWLPAGASWRATATDHGFTWTDDGSATGGPPLAGSRRYYRVVAAVEP